MRFLSCSVDSNGGDMEAGDRGEVASWADGDLFVVVQDPQVGVLNDDGHELAAMAWPEFDALTRDHDPAAFVDLALRS